MSVNDVSRKSKAGTEASLHIHHLSSLAGFSNSIVIMSKRGGQPGFATKSMFDVLQNDEPEEEEVEEEEVTLDQVVE